jgi:hypothetical protein
LRSISGSATVALMDGTLTYRGRVVTDADVAFVNKLIAEHPAASRRALSKKLCQAWGWVQPNGVPRDMVCRGLMLELHRRGRIELPAVRYVPPNNLIERRAARAIPIDVDTTPLRTPLSVIRPLRFRQVRRTSEEPLFEALIARYHYLGYTQPVGAHLKYLVYSGSRPVACFAWSSAPRHLGPRDRFIGWSAATRRRNLRGVVYNSRYLILPWVEVPHLASHLLGRMARILCRDWPRVYGHPIHFAETFVDPGRFRGTCYRAANWVDLGWTTGRGKDDQTGKPNRSLKQVLGYPLTRRFRQRLGA